MLRAILRAIIHLLFTLLTRLNVQGSDNVPAQGGAILAANHISRLDSPVVFMCLERQDATGLVADTYKQKFFFRILVNAVNGIWINRDEADLHALRTARDFLRQGGLLGIAPEGTRSPDGTLQSAKLGVAYLADKTSVPIIPVAIAGTEKAFDELFHLRRGRIDVCFGEPFSLPPVERRRRDESLQDNADEIMCRIAALLPLTYRGVYANHPRLREFLAE